MWWDANPRGPGHGAYEEPYAKRPRTQHRNGSQHSNWYEKRWNELPVAGRLGGPDWVHHVYNKEPPCLSLHGMQHSGNRIERIKNHEFDDAFHQQGDGSLMPRRHVLEALFGKLLDTVRFPPDAMELTWRAQAIRKPENFRHGDPLIPKDSLQVPEDLRGPFVQRYPFKLLNNLADAPAQQPPHFKTHGLRPEQLRSLGWMMLRESCEDGTDQPLDAEQEPFETEWRQMLIDTRECAVIDIRAKASHTIRGGILADRIGFGKTATTIGLIDATRDQPLAAVPALDSGSFIPAKSTLVIVPSNLLDQWANEISKFVWDGSRLVALHSGWKAGKSKDGCPLKVIAIGTVSPLRLLTAGELAEADVVLVSYRLLFSRIYLDRREDIAGGTSLPQLVEATRRLIGGNFQIGRGHAAKTYDANTLPFPILEMFYWRRVVFDEFHELESFQSEQQRVLQHMRAHSRWGLTGTPPIDNIAGVIFMSSLFRCDLPGHLPLEKAAVKKGQTSRNLQEVPNMLYYEQDKLMQEAANRFLDRFVRQNTAELPHITLQQHVILVQHRAAERALYLGEAYDAPDIDWSGDAALSEGKSQAIERKLQLCSHFQTERRGGNNAPTAAAECERVAEVKSRKRVAEKRQLGRCARVLQILSEKVGADSWWYRKDLDDMVVSLKAQGRPAVDVLGEEEQAAEHEDMLQRCRLLAGHRPRDGAAADALAACVDGEAGVGSLRHWEAFACMPLSLTEAQQLLTGQVQEQIGNLLTFCNAVASQQYFERVTKVLLDEWSQQRSCSICYAQDVDLSRLTMTPCAHSFCMACLRKRAETDQTCSCCAQPLKIGDVSPVVANIAAVQDKSHWPGSTTVTLAGDVPRSRWSDSFTRFGSKLSVLVLKLTELHQQDPTAKAILFVQFDDLKLQAAAALREGGVNVAQLRGSVGQRASIIRDFQENPDSNTFVLLLSLAESASGTNLTAASHIVFLHPMLASTEERAVAQELQAIGRARRHGQLRADLHVWRFVTAGTLEEAITQRHQRSLSDHETALKNRIAPKSKDTKKDEPVSKEKGRKFRAGVSTYRDVSERGNDNDEICLG